MTKEMTAIPHKGRAHLDEFIGTCILIAYDENITKVERRDPSEADIESLTAYVYDQGGIHDPARLCFDHHQMGPKSGVMAASLILDYIVEKEDLDRTGEFNINRVLNWLEYAVVLDNKGPDKLAELALLPKWSLEQLFSPVEAAMKEMFEKESVISHDQPLFQVMKAVGESILANVRTFYDKLYTAHAASSIIDFDDFDVLVVTEVTDPGTMKELRFDMGGDQIAISVMPDPRDGGWALYRWDDHPAVDFTQIKDDDRVLFAAKSGFIAKTKERIPLEEVEELLESALVEPEEAVLG
jgi:hypothetical protein